MKALCSCISCACCSILLCECNCIIFPSPSPSYSMPGDKQFKTFIQDGRHIPYLHLPYENSKINIIYFHGNAEDIGYAIQFLKPIQEGLKASVYAMQYPTYGTYDVLFPGLISNKIKSDSLDFYAYLTKSETGAINAQNTIVVGRSIGSGGASYLASQKKIQNLVLISPFSTIKQVGIDFVGCMGCIVKQHFNNIQEISKYQGNLLVIHGKIDQVINHRHGVLVKEAYNKANDKNHKQCEFVAPQNMSHNYFNYEADILIPIQEFRKRMRPN